tara:strand:+ start:57 stop:806 length:750 start_codon:yes stop_codon:yes gene_type:complete
MRDIRYHCEELWYHNQWEAGMIMPPIRRFAKFKYFDDVILKEDRYDILFNESFKQFKRDVNNARGLKEFTRKDVTLLLKIPILYSDYEREGKFRQPITFAPDNHDFSIDGCGRFLVGLLHDRDIKFDLLYYRRREGNETDLYKLIDILEKKNNIQDYEYIDCYYLNYPKNDMNGLHYTRQIDFIKNATEVRDYCGTWFLEIRDKLETTLFQDMLELIHNTTTESDEDYMSLLRAMCQLPHKFNTDILAY